VGPGAMQAAGQPPQPPQAPPQGAAGQYPARDSEQDLCQRFLEEGSSIKDGDTYMEKLQEIANRTLKFITIELDDVLEWTQQAQGVGVDFVDRISKNALLYTKLFKVAIDRAIPNPSVVVMQDPIDVLTHQRAAEANNAEAEQDEDGLPLQDEIPPELLRRAECYIAPLENIEARALRDVRAQDIGSLVRIRAMVTRVSDVKPQAAVVTFTCEVCNAEIYMDVSSQRTYKPVQECNARCKRERMKGRVIPQIRASKFVKHQEIRIQELVSPIETRKSLLVPTDHTPLLSISLSLSLSLSAGPSPHRTHS
jgi:DNA replication licensing factor MCM7